jgi:hypothetical protein
MLVRTFGQGKEITVDMVYDAVQSAGDVALAVSQLRPYLASWGIETTWSTQTTIGALFEALKNKRPAIVLLHYGTLVDAKVTDKTGFRGGHFLVATGMDIGAVAINDPYQVTPQREIPIGVFESAWQQSYLDGNPTNGALITKLPIVDLGAQTPAAGLYKVRITAAGLNVRPTPDTSKAPIRVLLKGAVATVYKLSTDKEWGFIGDGWIWLGYTARLP